jgi:hypothetical protein
MKTVLLVFLLLLTTSHCNTKPTNPILGQYELVGHDASGGLALSGTISFVSLEQNHLKGQCKIIREQNAPEGLYENEGNCEALIDGNKISLDSAPDFDDAGLLLEGEFDGVAIRGIWEMDGFVTRLGGKFEAVKKM